MDFWKGMGTLLCHAPAKVTRCLAYASVDAWIAYAFTLDTAINKTFQALSPAHAFFPANSWVQRGVVDTLPMRDAYDDCSWMLAYSLRKDGNRPNTLQVLAITNNSMPGVSDSHLMKVIKPIVLVACTS